MPDSLGYVLLIEDDATEVRLFRRMLKGYRLHYTAIADLPSLEEAIQFAERQRVNTVFMSSRLLKSEQQFYPLQKAYSHAKVYSLWNTPGDTSPMPAHLLNWGSLALNQVQNHDGHDYRLLFELNPMPMYMFHEQTLAILKVNQAAIQLYGYTEEEFLKMTIRELRPESELEQLMKAVKKQLHMTDSQFNAGTWKHLTKNGELIYAELYISPMVYDNQKVRLVAVNNISSRVQMETERDAFFKTTSDLMCVIDFRGNFRLLNPRWVRMLKYKSKELAGSNVINIIHPDDKRHTLHAIRKVLKAAQKRVSVDNRLLRKDGEYIYVNWNCSIDPDNRLIYAIARDITGLKEIEMERMRQQRSLESLVMQRTREINEANRELEAFNYSVSHDLRTPIRAMELYTDLLAAELQGTAQHAYVAQLNKCIDEMRNLIDDLLEFSKMGRTPMHKEQIDLSTMVQEVFSVQSAIQNSTGTLLEIGHLPPLNADPTLIRIVLNNLLSNAVKYSRHKEQPIVQVGAEMEQDKPIYFVRDNGVGFEPRYAQKLFQPFTRLHPGSAYKGNGAGLAIVERIITRHEGKIWAESTPGCGATFYFSIPALAGRKTPI